MDCEWCGRRGPQMILGRLWFGISWPPLTSDLLGVRAGLQRAVVQRLRGRHVGEAVVQHLLHAAHAAALAAHRGAGDGVVAAQAVHLTAGGLAVLQGGGASGWLLESTK